MATSVLTTAQYVANGARLVVRNSFGRPFVVCNNSSSDDINIYSYSLAAKDYKDSSSQSYRLLYAGGDTAHGQSFTWANSTRPLNSVAFRIIRTGSPTGTLVAKIYEHSGTYGTSSIPTGSPLATSETIQASDISTGAADFIEFSFSPDQQMTATAGSYYVVVVEFASTFSNGSNYLRTYGDSTAHSGSACYYDGSWTDDSFYDMQFYVYDLDTSSFGSALDSSNEPGYGDSNDRGPVSAAIDSNDVIHVVHFYDDGKSSDLRYSRFSTVSNTWVEVDTVLNADIGETPTMSSLYCAIAIDSNDVPHVAYTKYTKIGGTPTYDLYYMNKTSGTWQSEVTVYSVAGENSIGIEIVIDADNVPIILNNYTTSTSVPRISIYKGSANNATSFTEAAVTDDSSLYNRVGSSLVINDDGDYWLSYITTIDSNPRIKTLSYGSAWSGWTNTSGYDETNSQDGVATSLATDGSNLYVFYENDSDNIAYDVYDGSSTWDGETELQTGTLSNVKAIRHGYHVCNDSTGTVTRANIADIDYVYLSSTTLYFDTLSLGGGDLSVNVSDGLTLGESVTVDDIPNPTATESTITLGESVTVELDDLEASVTDTIAIGESVDLEVGGLEPQTIDVSETAVTIGESVTVELDDLKASVSDTVAVADTANLVLDDLEIDESDGLTVADTATVALGDLEVDESDGLTVADTASASIALEASVTDTIASGELLTVDLRAAWYNPDSITINTGSIVSGDIEDTWSDNDTYLQLAETTGTPGFDYDFYFYDVPATAYTISINGYYEGNPGHNVKIQQYNFTTTNWTDLTSDPDDFPSTGADATYQFPLFGGANYNSGGEVRLKIVHTSAGSNLHNFYLDHMVMSSQVLSVHPDHENITLGESVTIALDDLKASISDGLTVADTANVAFDDLEIDESDGLTVADTTTLALDDLEASVSDSITVEDTAALALDDLEASVTDTVEIGESASADVGAIAPQLIDVTDTLEVADTTSVNVAVSIDESDGLTVADTANATLDDLEASTTDTITAEDAANVNLQEAGAISIDESDNLTIADTANIALDSLEVSASDGLTVADTANASLPEIGALALSVSDNVIVADAAIASIILEVDESDSLTVADTANVNLPEIAALSIDVSDGLTAADTVNISLDDLVIGASDSLTVADVTSATLDDLEASVTDTVAVADAANVSLPEIGAISISESDNVTVADTANASITLEVDESDNATVADTANVSLPEIGALALSVSDNIAVGESAGAVLDDLGTDVTDTVTVGESVSVSVQEATAVSVDVSDNLTVADTATVTLPDALAIGAADSLAITDTATAALPDALAISVSDSSAIADTTSAALNDLEFSASDDLTVGDTTNTEIGDLYVAVSDDMTIAATDFVWFEGVDFFINVGDPLTVGDVLAVHLFLSTPSCKTLFVDAESRVLDIDAETRTVSIPAESRTLEVEC